MRLVPATAARAAQHSAPHNPRRHASTRTQRHRNSNCVKCMQPMLTCKRPRHMHRPLTQAPAAAMLTQSRTSPHASPSPRKQQTAATVPTPSRTSSHASSPDTGSCGSDAYAKQNLFTAYVHMGGSSVSATPRLPACSVFAGREVLSPVNTTRAYAQHTLIMVRCAGCSVQGVGLHFTLKWIAFSFMESKYVHAPYRGP